MARLGYVRNRAARSTFPRRTGVIALVVCEAESKLFSDAFFSRILRGVRRELTHGEHQYGEQQLVLLRRTPPASIARQPAICAAAMLTVQCS